jgi:hypothetical protein
MCDEPLHVDGEIDHSAGTVTIPSDPTFRQQIAGHVETGRHSVTDPAIAT